MSIQSQAIPTFEVLSFQDVEYAKHYFEIEYHKVGDVLLKPGEVCDKLYFIFNGLISCRSETNEIKWFEAERVMVTEITSFIERLPSEYYLNVVATDAVIVSITNDKLNQLIHKSHKWAIWSYVMMKEFVTRVNHFYLRLRIKDATERYHHFIEAYPWVLERIPLKEIASCLNMSAVSLSRIRSGAQK